ncbi:MAG: dockerin type I repeat-containing protein, partial [Chloroflexota bacterium]
VSIVSMVAETALSTGIDTDNVAVVNVKINRGKNPGDGSTVQISGGVAAFSATASSAQATGMIGAFSGMEFVGVREVAPYLNPTFNATSGVFGVSNVASPEQPNNSTVVKLLMKLNGDKDTAYTFSVAFQSITAATGGANVPEDSAKTLNFRRGDTNGNGVVDVFDAMFIAQYIVGVRPASQINSVNAACVKHDTDNDKVDIFDAMYIAQMVVGLRNNRFE